SRDLHSFPTRRSSDLDSATVARAGGDVVLRDLGWTVNAGETWAVVGPVGAGKTTLAEVLLGRHRLTGGTIAWPLLDRLRAAGRRSEEHTSELQSLRHL